MTAAQTSSSPAPSLPAGSLPAPSLLARARDVLGSEWTKLWSVRSTYWTLLIAVVTSTGISALVALTLAKAPRAAARPLADPLLASLASLEYAVIAIGVLGVLAFTSEYSSGLIRTTFAAVPQRGAVLAAKAAVIGLVTLVLGEVLAFASFLLTQAILSGHNGISLSHPGAPRAVLGLGILLFVCAMIGLGLGAVLRHTAGSVAALAGVIYLPAIVGLLPAPWNDRIGRFTIIDTARQVVALHPVPGLFSPAVSALVLLAWPAAAITAAALTIARRDA